jgi:hypothetical protein
LKGRKLLFKVEKTSVASVLFDGSYRVKRVCYDPNIIESFLLNAKESTPLKVCVFYFVFSLLNSGCVCLRARL